MEHERNIRDCHRNLVIAATGTGKTVIAAFDFKRFYEKHKKQVRLLFVAHREQILFQARNTFCNVLRDQNFGEILTGNQNACRLEHLFCSVGMVNSRTLWQQVGSGFYSYIVIDEVHHGTADSYRPIFEHFSPDILLGLTATPERLDGQNVVADFDNHFAAEIRLLEALDEKLLCPFHYFGVADTVSLDDDRFWRNGKYDETALENVYVYDRVVATKRLDAILAALQKYEPDFSTIKGIGFCVTIRHAQFMAEEFSKLGIPSGVIVSGVDSKQCSEQLSDLNNGKITFLFTVDKLSEGVDLPDINTILFLRPTESLTVFLQQLGRGLRHAPGKDCCTVLDFVGQVHRKYRIDNKFKAILPRHRFSIEKEVHLDFPHMPAGCSIQLDRLTKKYVIENIRANINNLSLQLPEKLRTFEFETSKKLTFGNFIDYHDYEPEVLLNNQTWSSWKAKALLAPIPMDPDLTLLKRALIRIAFTNGPKEIAMIRDIVMHIKMESINSAIERAGKSALLFYYRIWGEPANKSGMDSIEKAFVQLGKNPTICSDILEILDWSNNKTDAGGWDLDVPDSIQLELHAQYGIKEIQALFGKANLHTAGQTGVGMLYFSAQKVYAMLITFQKLEKDFSPSTMYADYPVSRDLMHWESQSTISKSSQTGQNLINHKEYGITILLFVRSVKKRNGVTVPYVCLGPADLVSYESERPIRIVWKLQNPMPVELFEENRKG